RVVEDLAEEDAREVRVRRDVVDEGVEHAVELLAAALRAVERLLEGGPEPGEVLEEHRVVELLLPGEVLEEGRCLDADAGRDLPQPRAGEAALGEEVFRRLE